MEVLIQTFYSSPRLFLFFWSTGFSMNFLPVWNEEKTHLQKKSKRHSQCSSETGHKRQPSKVPI